MGLVFKWVYRNEGLVVRLLLELNLAIDQRIEGVVLSHADIYTSIVDSSSLTHDDISGNNLLSAVYFNTESFAFRFATVS